MRGSLAAHEVTKSYGAETILDRVSLSVPPGARIGVLGPNGIGKSTLLRVLAGVEEPDSGSVARDGEVGWLPQEPDAPPAGVGSTEPARSGGAGLAGAGARGETLLGYLARRTGVAAAEAELDALAARLGAEPELAARYSETLDRYLALGGGDFEARARAVCAEVGLAGLADRTLDAVSGGQAARARLAAILLARFDVFLLDEPTNDLDFDGLALLERFVAGLRGTLVVVSHDRAFLERAVERIVELEPETRRVREFAGGFAEYERMRAAARRAEEAAWERYAEERERFGGLLSTRRTEARAGGKQADRRGTHALSAKVRSAERRLERLDSGRPDKPWSPWKLQLELAAGPRGGDVVVALEGAVVERGAFELGPVDLELRRGDRLALVGPNGSGKTTLLAALLGELPLAAGRRRLGPGARLGRLDQARSLFETDEPLLEPFRREVGLSPGEAEPARPLRAPRRHRPPPRPRALARRADARARRPAHRRRRQRARPRRADEPPRPRGDRGAGDRARRLRGRRRPRHARPAAAGRVRSHPHPLAAGGILGRLVSRGHQVAVRVLIVDDDEVFAKSLASRLGADGRIEIVARATRGTDALRLTRELQPDVVLMDIAMPRMDGLTAARRLRKTCPGVRVVMLTGSDIAADKNRAREVGASYFRKDAIEGLADALCA